MKKITALFLILVLSLSVFGCEPAPETDDTAVNIIENETPPYSTEQVTDKQDTEDTEDVTDEAPETVPEEQPLETTPELAPDTETKTEESENGHDITEQENTKVYYRELHYFTDVVSSDDEPAIVWEPHPLKLLIKDNTIVDRIAVTIRKGYSKIKSEYTVSDFPYLNLKKVETINLDHIGDNGEQGRVSLKLYFKDCYEYTGNRLRKNADSLRSDARIYDLNLFVEDESGKEVITDDYVEEKSNLVIDDSYWDNYYFTDAVSPYDEDPFWETSNSRYGGSSNISSDCLLGHVTVVIKKGYSKKKKEYTVEDFPYLNLENVEVIENSRPDDNAEKGRISLKLTFKHLPTKENLLETAGELRKDARIYAIIYNYNRISGGIVIND